MKTTSRLRIAALFVIVLAAGCAKKPATTPPPAPAAKQNVFALLPEPDGTAKGIEVRNQGGSRNLDQPYQAVQVQRADTTPSAPYTLTQADVRRLFGTALDSLPDPEVVFVLHFDEGRDVLNAESQAQIPAILNAIRERHSTAITVTGHTDTTANPQFNNQLGMRRAQNVANILKLQGVNDSDLVISSHGQTDLLVPTGPGVSEARNRRVEVIVR